MNINEFIKNGYLAIVVRPSSPKSEILGYDESRKALKVAIAAAPDKNKANIEVIKFFSKLTKKKVEIVSGIKSKSKVLRFS